MTVELVELMGPEARAIDPHGLPFPDDTVAMYGMEDGVPVGRSAILHFPHIESTWVDESKRGSSLALRLVRSLEKKIAEHGYSHAYAYVYENDPQVADYLERVGYVRAPLAVYFKQVKEDETCPS